MMSYYNGTYEVAADALRYLANHERPTGGQQQFNAEHLFQLADELAEMKTERDALKERLAVLASNHTDDIHSIEFLKEKLRTCQNQEIAGFEYHIKEVLSDDLAQELGVGDKQNVHLAFVRICQALTEAREKLAASEVELVNTIDVAYEYRMSVQAEMIDRARVDAEMARLRDAAWERFDNAEVEERAIAKLAFNEIDAASARLGMEVE